MTRKNCPRAYSGPVDMYKLHPLTGYTNIAMTRTYQYLTTLPVVLGAGLVAHLMQPYFEQTNIAMVYMLAIVMVAFFLGTGPAIVTCLLSISLFDFINVPPHFAFESNTYEYAFTLMVMLVTAISISWLAEQLRQQAADSADREARAAALYSLSTDLAEKPSCEAIIDAARLLIASSFHADVNIFYPKADDSLLTLLPQIHIDDFESSDGLLTHESADKVMIEAPLNVDGALYGLVLVSSTRRWLGKREQRHHLATMLHQSAQAIERINLRKRIHDTEIRIQKESLRNSILSTISHDLRTPLASIIGASSSLMEEGEIFSQKAREKLLSVINEESVHLLSMVENLLGMAKLQGGDVKVAHEWEALEEIVGSSVSAIKRRDRTHEIHVNVPDNLPLVQGDAALLERVIINLLENARKFSPTGSAITLSACIAESAVKVTVADLGMGIPLEHRQKVFDPFYRLHPSVSGGGLGLTICRSIIEAHGGRIWIAPENKKGTQIEFTLPIHGHPQMPDLEAPYEHG